jgi:hypothetical protein
MTATVTHDEAATREAATREAVTHEAATHEAVMHEAAAIAVVRPQVASWPSMQNLNASASWIWTGRRTWAPAVSQPRCAVLTAAPLWPRKTCAYCLIWQQAVPNCPTD